MWFWQQLCRWLVGFLFELSRLFQKNPGLASEYSQRQAWSGAPVSQELKGFLARLPTSSYLNFTREGCSTGRV